MTELLCWKAAAAFQLQRSVGGRFFHATLTLPAQLRPLVMGNQKLLYTLLFRSVKEALEALAAESRWIGGRIGFTAVLHTWAKDLQFHPHIHIIVTAGGLRADGSWKFAQEKFLFPVRKLSYEFKHRFMKGLAKLYRAGELSFQGSTEHLSDPVEFFALEDKLMRKKWVVDIRKPFFEGRHVIQYLGRHTHRVAVSNGRLLEVNETIVFR